MIGKSKDSHHLLNEDELRQLFQQFEPVEIPVQMRDNIRMKLLDEVANTLPTPSSRSPELEFPMVGWLRRFIEQLPRFQLGPSLVTAAMGAVATVLFMFLYPVLTAPPTAEITILDALDIQEGDVSVLAQNRRSQLVSLGASQQSTMEEGDQLFAYSSSILIEFANGWKSTVQPGTIFEIVTFAKSRDQVDIALSLIDGEIITEIDRELGYQGTIKVHTKSGTAQAVGTKFVVRTNSETSSYFAVLTGKIQVSSVDGIETNILEENEQMIARDGETKIFKNQTLVVGETDILGGAYVTANWSDVALYAGPNKNTSQLGSLSITDKIELVGSTADHQWYVVCCVFNELFSWVDASSVSIHNIHNIVPKFSNELIPQNSQTVIPVPAPSQEAPRAIENASPNPVNNPQTNNPTGGTDTPDPVDEPSQVIPPTSTAVPFFRLTATTTGTSQARPQVPDIEPDLPAPGAVVEANTDPTSELISPPTAGGVIPVPSPPAPGNSTANENNGNENVSGTNSTPLSEPTATTGSVNTPTAIPTNTLPPTDTPVPPTATNRPRPNTATNTPITTEVVPTIIPATVQPPATATPIPSTDIPEPTTSTATSVPSATSAPTATPESTATSEPTATAQIIPPTDTPNTVTPSASPTAVPTSTPEIRPPTATLAAEATVTPLPIATTAVSTPSIVTITPEDVNTPKPTSTPQIITPTHTPMVDATATPNPKLTAATEPPGTPSDPAATGTPNPANSTETPVAPSPTPVPQIVVPTVPPSGATTATPTPSTQDDAQGNDEQNRVNGSENSASNQDSHTSGNTAPDSGE